MPGHPPEAFDEHCRFACPFCNQMVQLGMNLSKAVGAKRGMMVIHANPVCSVFEHCDSTEQYMMFVKLKEMSNHGCRVIN